MPRAVDMVSDSVERVPKPASVVAVACSRCCDTDATSFSMRGSASGRTACACDTTVVDRLATAKSISDFVGPNINTSVSGGIAKHDPHYPPRAPEPRSNPRQRSPASGRIFPT